MKLTPWFRWDDRPVRCGVYEVRLAGEKTAYSYYNVYRNRWGFISPTVDRAYELRASNSNEQRRVWRGREACE